jgi:hypothetical protein
VGQGKRRQLPSDHICFNFLKGIHERGVCPRAHLSYFQIYNSLPRIKKVRCFWAHSPPSCLHNTSSLYAILKTVPSPCSHSPYQETTTAAAAPVHVNDGPPVVRLPSVRFPGETEYSSQHPLYAVRFPETSIPYRQGSMGSPLDTIVCNLRNTGAQGASTNRVAEMVQFFFFSLSKYSLTSL